MVSRVGQRASKTDQLSETGWGNKQHVAVVVVVSIKGRIAGKTADW